MAVFRINIRQTVKLVVVVLGVFFTVYSLLLLRSEPSSSKTATGSHHEVNKPVAWIYAKKEVAMSHVMAVFNRLGYRIVHQRYKPEEWDVMWSHGYPFGTLKSVLQNIKPHQKVNHFPGIGCLTSKPRLAAHNFIFTPKAFSLPDQSSQFLDEVKKRPDSLWVQKNNKHRGIKIKKPKDIAMKESGTIVQEFLSNPLLIDGRKFDIGIYVLVTSINPLIAYVYGEEVLVRFCAKEYLPFDAKDKQKYVVDDDYTPSWKIPTLAPLIDTQGLSHKDALSRFIKQKGHDPNQIWTDCYSIIQKVLQHCEVPVLNYTSHFPSSRNFFEFVRFDFIIDENFRVWLMEANLSPNLSSAHTIGNRNMYEQLIYNVLNLVGLSRGTEPGLRYNGQYESVMFVNEHDIQPPLSICSDASCTTSCSSNKLCELCKSCRKKDFEFTLKTAFLHFVSRRNFQRLIPTLFEEGCNVDVVDRTLTAARWSNGVTKGNNELIEAWFYGKCCQSRQWC